MTLTVYEEPAKTEMRLASEVAIDRAGYALVTDLVTVSFDDQDIHGGLRADLQSLDSDGRRSFYFVRPGADGTLPKWLATLARAARRDGAGAFHVVVREVRESFRASCAAAGAGLLRLTDDESFEVVLDFDDLVPTGIEPDRAEQVRLLRREMETKVDFRQKEIEQRVNMARPHMADMDDEVGERYEERFEREYGDVDEWGDEISRELDAVAEAPTDARIAAVRERIAAGPPRRPSA
jgi:hypothetical protein